MNGLITEIQSIMTRFLSTNLTRSARHGTHRDRADSIYSFNLFKEVEELRNVEKQFAKALGIPIDQVGEGHHKNQSAKKEDKANSRPEGEEGEGEVGNSNNPLDILNKKKD